MTMMIYFIYQLLLYKIKYCHFYRQPLDLDLELVASLLVILILIVIAIK